MIQCVKGPPWPEGLTVVLLDEVRDLSMRDLAALERRRFPAIGAVEGTCEGACLALAMALDLVVASPDALFGRPGAWWDIVIRRGIGVAGRKVMAYLVMTERMIGAALARDWGIVWDVVSEPVSAAIELGQGIASRPRKAVETILRECHRGASAHYILTRWTGGQGPLPRPQDMTLP